MCGIVGTLVFKNSNFEITTPYLERMRDSMVHRGPDGAGVWISDDGKVGLGHRRLSIIDLSDEAGQPMCNEDRSLWISYNGEIYNHVAIRSEIEATGDHRWKTDHSDTEVILHAYEQWGIECIHKFRGMFAFALWDERKRELWLVRDRIGIKPLYYSVHNGRITFASEIKALLQDPDQERTVNEEAFYHYLSFLTAPAPDTLFDGIKKLPGGSLLKINHEGTMRESRYWDVWDHTDPLINVSEEDISHMLLDELRTSVKLRKVSDVPVGVFLSGGIDSSTNAALFSEGESRAIKTFSIGYEGEYQSYQNELNYARRMADEVNAEYYEKLLTIDDLIDFLPHMVYLQDEPIADPVCVPVYYVSKLARDNGVIVCQVGEGSDELFWGYEGWKTAHQLQRYDDLPLPRVFKKLGLTFLGIFGKKDTVYYEWLRRGTIGQPVFWGGAEAFTEAQKQQLLSPRIQQKFRSCTSWDPLESIYDRFREKAWEKSHLNWMTYVDLNLRLPELLLMRIDKMSMGVSLEGRVPFLDHKFVELAMSIPESIKMKNGSLKYILKKSIRGIIPSEMINRRKQGFGVPVYEWLSDTLGERIKVELESFCEKSDYFNYSAVQNLMNKGDRSKIWYLFNFVLWINKFINA